MADETKVRGALQLAARALLVLALVAACTAALMSPSLRPALSSVPALSHH